MNLENVLKAFFSTQLPKKLNCWITENSSGLIRLSLLSSSQFAMINILDLFFLKTSPPIWINLLVMVKLGKGYSNHSQDESAAR